MNLYVCTYNGQIYLLSGHPTNLVLKRRNQISETSIRALYLPGGSQELLCGGFESQITSINKYTLNSMKQTKQPKGIINCIHPINDHVIAVGHENGLIRFWDWKNWNLKKQLRQHKKPIRNFTIDKNEVMFFSVAGKSLILWDTTKYEKVFHYKFDYDIEHVLVDETMTYILLINQKQIHQILISNNQQIAVCKIQGAELIQTAAIYKNFVIIGGDKGNIFIYNLGSYQHKISFKAHQLRVKCMKVITFDEIDYLITASTSGEISSWDILQFLKQVQKISQDYQLDGLQPLSTQNIEKRVICIETTIINQTQISLNQNKIASSKSQEKKEISLKHKKNNQIQSNQEINQQNETVPQKRLENKLQKIKKIEKNKRKMQQIKKINKIKQKKLNKNN